MRASPRLAETARLVEAEGRRCLAAPVDVRDGAAVAAFTERAATTLGRLDVLCANAGVISFGAAWELTEEQWDVVLGVNLTGVWRCCRAAVPHMLARGEGGAIVVTLSTAALKGLERMAHYAAAKHGCVGLARSLARELAPHRIRFACMLPLDLVEPEDVSAAVVWLASDAARHVTGAVLPVDAGTLLR